MALVASEEMLRDAFKLFDTEEPHGFLTVNELVGIFTRPGGGRPMTEEEAVAFVEKHDTNKDGKLDIDEFAKALITNKQLDDARRNADEKAMIHADMDKRVGRDLNEKFKGIEPATDAEVAELSAKVWKGLDNLPTHMRDPFKMFTTMDEDRSGFLRGGPPPDARTTP